MRHVHITTGPFKGHIVPVLHEDDKAVRVQLPTGTAVLPKRSEAGAYFEEIVKLTDSNIESHLATISSASESIINSAREAAQRIEREGGDPSSYYAALNAARMRLVEAKELSKQACGISDAQHPIVREIGLQRDIERLVADLAAFITSATASEGEVDIDEIEDLLERQEAANEALSWAEASFRSAIIHLNRLFHILDGNTANK